MDTIELTISFDYPSATGQEAVVFPTESSANKGIQSRMSALVRPLRQLFQEGKPIGRINYVFYEEDNLYYVLGSLCYSPAARILYFPGIEDRSIQRWYEGDSGTLEEGNIGGIIDHFTLEPNLQDGHITPEGLNYEEAKKVKGELKYRSRSIDANTVWWLGLSLKNARSLEKLRRTIKIAFPSPPDDADRRIKEITKARNNAVFHVISLANEEKFGANEFLHFEFVIQTSKHGELRSYYPLALPRSSDIGGVKYENEFLVRKHPVSLRGLQGKVWIVASKHVGKLRNDAPFFALPSKYSAVKGVE